MSEKLLPCPFCGEQLQIHGDYTSEAAWNYYEHRDPDDCKCILSDHQIHCGADMRTPLVKEAEAWNTRAGQPVPSSTVGELERIADVIEPHWRGAGLNLTPDWIIEQFIKLGDGVAALSPSSVEAPVAWRSTSAALRKFITQETYDGLSADARKWYEPFKCATCASPPPPDTAVRQALELAVNIIMASEPADSRGVSNEAVALCAISIGDTSEPVMKVIHEALAALPPDAGVRK